MLAAAPETQVLEKLVTLTGVEPEISVNFLPSEQQNDAATLQDHENKVTPSVPGQGHGCE